MIDRKSGRRTRAQQARAHARVRRGARRRDAHPPILIANNGMAATKAMLLREFAFDVLGDAKALTFAMASGQDLDANVSL